MKRASELTNSWRTLFFFFYQQKKRRSRNLIIYVMCMLSPVLYIYSYSVYRFDLKEYYGEGNKKQEKKKILATTENIGNYR